MIKQYEFNQIQNTVELLKLKNQIEDSITTPMTWHRRIELYKIVKLINERIDMINKNQDLPSGGLFFLTKLVN